MADPFYNPVVPEHVPPALVHDFNMYDPAAPGIDVFQTIRAMHERGLPPIFWTRTNGGHWVVLKGAAIAEAIRDPQRFSSKRILVPDEQNFDVPFFVPLMSDPPDHAGYRALCMPLFTPKRIDELRASVIELTGNMIDEMKPRGRCEFMADFALQMPIIVFLRLVDLPAEDREQLLELATGIVSPEEGELRDTAMQKVFAYLRPIIAQRVASPHDDVFSKMVTGTYQGRPLSTDEMLGLAATILVGGLDTVAATLGFVARYLADNPGARRLLRKGTYNTNAVTDELLRRYPVTSHGRHVVADTEFRGVKLRKNDYITWTAAMYNFDDAVFPDPMTVNFDRKRSAHLSFGSGIHFCIGAFLARMEMDVFIRSWLDKIPDFRVEEGHDVQHRFGINLAYKALPLTWDA
jgi:camphor 5-monooxygenase